MRASPQTHTHTTITTKSDTPTLVTHATRSSSAAMPWDAHQGSDDAAESTPLATLSKVGEALVATAEPPAPEEELTTEERIE